MADRRIKKMTLIGGDVNKSHVAMLTGVGATVAIIAGLGTAYINCGSIAAGPIKTHNDSSRSHSAIKETLATKREMDKIDSKVDIINKDISHMREKQQTMQNTQTDMFKLIRRRLRR